MKSVVRTYVLAALIIALLYILVHWFWGCTTATPAPDGIRDAAPPAGAVTPPAVTPPSR